MQDNTMPSHARGVKEQVLRALSGFGMVLFAVLLAGCESLPISLPNPMTMGQGKGGHKKIAWKVIPAAIRPSVLPSMALQSHEDLFGTLSFFHEGAEGCDLGGFRFKGREGTPLTYPRTWRNVIVDAGEIRWPNGESWAFFVWDCRDHEKIRIRTLSLFDPREKELFSCELGFRPAELKLASAPVVMVATAPTAPTMTTSATATSATATAAKTTAATATAAETTSVEMPSTLERIATPPVETTPASAAIASRTSQVGAVPASSSLELASGSASPTFSLPLSTEFPTQHFVHCDLPNPFWAEGSGTAVRCRFSWKLGLSKFKPYRDFLSSVKAGYADVKSWGTRTEGLQQVRTGTCASATFAFDREPPFADGFAAGTY